MVSRRDTRSRATELLRPTVPDFHSFDLDPEEVRGRFRRAQAQGRPAWLWPEVSPADWRDACERIGRVSQQLLGAGDVRVALLDGGPLPISLAAYTSGMGPLLGWWSSQGRLHSTKHVGAVLQLHLEHNRLRTMRMRAALQRLLDDFADEGIVAAVLKGMHTSGIYFPDAATRPASDIDLLVSPEDASHSESILAREGYGLASRSSRDSSWRHATIADQPRSLLLVHADDPWTIDLHTTLDLQPTAGVAAIPFDRCKPLAATNRKSNGLAQPLLLLHLAAHASAGLQNLTLLRLVELQFVIRRDMASGALDWDSLLRLGKQIGALGFAWPALELTEDLAPGIIPEDVLAEMKRAAPAAVHRVMHGLTAATAQRLDRLSVREHFMWSSGVRGAFTQFAADLRPSGAWKDTARIYDRRLRQLVRGRLSR